MIFLIDYSFFMCTRDIFRTNLKHYRKKLGLTQEALSVLIGFGETYITEIESRRKFPKPETIDLIAEKLEIAPYELFRPLDDCCFDMKILHLLRCQINELFENISLNPANA